ncbi:hypothetical protein [Nonomuraea sp. NPDC001831]|uniref:hypothetical protein n=1 Tax=Nonomuraea sp. NPDC001831 TaxID=3364340 RepID=UPI0036B8F43E
MTAITFDHAATGYTLAQARRLAHAAALACKDEPVVRATASSWGFDRVRCFRVPHAAPFPLEDTQAYAAASDHMIVVAFRGTQPEELRDWLSDAAERPLRRRPGSAVVTRLRRGCSAAT